MSEIILSKSDDVLKINLLDCVALDFNFWEMCKCPLNLTISLKNAIVLRDKLNKMDLTEEEEKS